MMRLRSLIETVSRGPSTVLLQGESGSGKELIAHYLHDMSPRRGGPFVPVDCTTLRDTLLESQLFGHVRGAFTGADSGSLGFFRAADGGSLFLDEIGELPLPLQAKLLRCIQERAVIPVGGTQPIPVDVRIIAATHRDLKAMVRAGSFRQDLYFRVHVVRVEVPPLRERRTDIALLVEHFLARIAADYGEPVKGVMPDAMQALISYDWPGNVRELANALERAHVLSAGRFLQLGDLPVEVRLAGEISGASSGEDIPPLEVVEKSLIIRALRATEGNQSQAARILKIERRRLYRKVRKYGLQTLSIQH
jgi:transcriptional regulator with PAS, ATPase and Fis domain